MHDLVEQDGEIERGPAGDERGGNPDPRRGEEPRDRRRGGEHRELPDRDRERGGRGSCGGAPSARRGERRAPGARGARGRTSPSGGLRRRAGIPRAWEGRAGDWRSWVRAEKPPWDLVYSTGAAENGIPGGGRRFGDQTEVPMPRRSPGSAFPRLAAVRSVARVPRARRRSPISRLASPRRSGRPSRRRRSSGRCRRLRVAGLDPDGLASYVALLAENVAALTRSPRPGASTDADRKAFADGLRAVAAALQDQAALAGNRGLLGTVASSSSLEETCRSCGRAALGRPGSRRASAAPRSKRKSPATRGSGDERLENTSLGAGAPCWRR